MITIIGLAMNDNTPIKKNYLHIVLISFLLFIMGFSFTYVRNYIKSFDYEYKFNPDVANSQGGEFVRFVYIGSSNCSFSNEYTHKMVTEIKYFIQNLAHESNYNFISTGISSDFNSVDGIRF